MINGDTYVTMVLIETDSRTIQMMTITYSSENARNCVIQVGMVDGVATGRDRVRNVLKEQNDYAVAVYLQPAGQHRRC